MARKNAALGATIAAVTLGFCGFVSHASAAVEIVTYTGTILDDAGLYTSFMFIGETYTATFVQIPERGGSYTTIPGSYISSAGSGKFSPIVIGTFTIAGKSFSFSAPGNDYASLLQKNSAVYGSAAAQNSLVDYHHDDSYDYNGYVDTVHFHYNISVESYGPNLTFTSGMGNTIGGYGNMTASLDIFDYDQPWIDQYYSFQGDVSTVSISTVPEISTWTMMLSGLAGLGFAGYRRKVATLAA
jgi:hypothetical protein